MDMDLENLKTINTNISIGNKSGKNSNNNTRNLQETLNLTLNTKTSLNMNEIMPNSNSNYQSMNSNYMINNNLISNASNSNKEYKFNKLVDLRKEDRLFNSDNEQSYKSFQSNDNLMSNDYINMKKDSLNDLAKSTNSNMSNNSLVSKQNRL